jgi:hypothetical protein
MLSEAKHLPRRSEMLRFAQGDNEVETFAHVCLIHRIAMPFLCEE